MLKKVIIDFETRSEVDLTKTNPWTYSEHPSTQVICLAWKFVPSEELHSSVWVAPRFSMSFSERDWFDNGGAYHGGYDIPAPLKPLILHTDTPFYAYNVAFEISIWRNVMVRQFGWPDIPLERWHDSQAVANYLALPPSLGALGKVVGEGGKDPRGERLISRYSKLNLKTAKKVIPVEDVKAFAAYCQKDVLLEAAVDEALGDLPEAEEKLFQEDLAMNMRGLRLDVSSIEKALKVVEERQSALANAFRARTKLMPTQHAMLKKWLEDNGLPLADMQGATVEKALEGDVPEHVREVLELRRSYNKASTKKLKAMLRNVSSDGRARFQTRYHGAATGRNTGAGMQPLNFPRTHEEFDPEQIVSDINFGSPELLDMVYGDAMDVVSKALRHYIVPEEGKRFIVADFVSIEAVLLAVSAGEDWKVEAFRNKEPIYERTADLIYRLPPGTVTKRTHPDKRHVGKVCELASGYQGSVGAWRKFDNSDRFSDDEVKRIVSKWREAHPATVAFWSELEHAAKEVVLYGGEAQVGDYVRVGTSGSFMYLEAPNGKRIWYASPEVVMAMPAWHNEEEDLLCALGTCSCKETLQLRYMSWKAGMWRRVYTYGGKLTENWCQFLSRELLRAAQTRVLAAGYPVVLSVYDELVAEISDGFGSVSEMVRIMEEPVEWAEGWPYRADGWEGRRYKK